MMIREASTTQTAFMLLTFSWDLLVSWIFNFNYFSSGEFSFLIVVWGQAPAAGRWDVEHHLCHQHHHLRHHHCPIIVANIITIIIIVIIFFIVITLRTSSCCWAVGGGGQSRAWSTCRQLWKCCRHVKNAGMDAPPRTLGRRGVGFLPRSAPQKWSKPRGNCGAK